MEVFSIKATLFLEVGIGKTVRFQNIAHVDRKRCRGKPIPPPYILCSPGDGDCFLCVKGFFFVFLYRTP